MLRVLSFLACSLFLLYRADAQCQYHLALFDGFGDGWTGGKVTAVNGVLSTDLTLATGKSDTLSFDVQGGIPLQLLWTAGSDDSEVSFVLYDNLWEVVYTSKQPFVAGQVFEGLAECFNCAKPRNAYIENVYDVRTKLRWQQGGTAPVSGWLVVYGPPGFSLTGGEGDTLIVTTPKAEITGLQKKTGYDAYVIQQCGPFDFSQAVGPFSFVTYYTNDVGISAVVTPQSSCDIGTATVSVRMNNYGSDPQSLIPFKYNVNGVDAGVSQPQDGFYTGVLGKDSSDVIEFDLTYSFLTPGEYEIAAYTQLEGDEDASNDTVFYYVNNRLEPAYSQNFEKWDGGWTVDTASQNPSWQFGTPAKPGFEGAASGKNAWITSLTGTYNLNEKSFLNSPCFDFSKLTSDPVIQFSLNYDLESEYDGAALEISFDNEIWEKVGGLNDGINWYNELNVNNNLGAVWSGTSDGWTFTRRKLVGTKGKSEVHFRFRLDSDGVVPAGGIAVDDIRIFVPQAKDLTALDLTTEGNSTVCGLAADVVQLSLANLGAEPQSPYQVAYSINGGTLVIETIITALAPEQQSVYEFNTTFDSRDGLFTIRAWTLLSGEENPSNDTAIYTVDHRPLPVPFQEDFEGTTAVPAGWVTEGFVTSSHNNATNVLATQLAAFNTSFETDLPRYGYIKAGDSLRFDYRIVNPSGSAATPLQGGSKIDVQISDDCGDTYQTAFTISALNHTPTLNLKTVNVGLDAYVGKAIFIRFKGSWGAGDFFFDLDNINLRACGPNMALSATTKGASQGQNNGSATITVGLGNPPYQFVWSTGDTTSNPTLTDLAIGNYTVSVTDSRGCSDVLAFSIGISAISNLPGLASLQLQPNPTGGASLLVAAFDRPVDGQLQVLDLLGRPVMEVNFAGATALSETIALDKQPTGLYLVRLAVEGRVMTRKLVKW